MKKGKLKVNTMAQQKKNNRFDWTEIIFPEKRGYIKLCSSLGGRSVLGSRQADENLIYGIFEIM